MTLYLPGLLALAFWLGVVAFGGGLIGAFIRLRPGLLVCAAGALLAVSAQMIPAYRVAASLGPCAGERDLACEIAQSLDERP